jgi:hypothetical protein
LHLARSDWYRTCTKLKELAPDGNCWYKLQRVRAGGLPPFVECHKISLQGLSRSSKCSTYCPEESSSSTMSLQQDTKPMFTGQLKRRVRTDEAWYHAELFLLSESHWTLSMPNLQGFPITGQNSSTTQTTQTTSHWRRAKATLKWFGIRALMVKRGLSFANGDPVPEQLLLASESAYAHNCTRNLFHSLPMELILEIASYLSPVARLVMQRVCRKFRAGLAPHRIAPELRSGFLTMKQIFQFVFLLRQDVQVRLQDDYERECDLAPPNSSLHRSGCSGCRTTHQMKYFSSEELSLSPKIRICKGLAAPFRLCRHLLFSGQCLLRALRVMKNMDYICQLEHENDVHNKFMVRLGGRQSGPRIGFHGRHTITIDETIPILKIGNDEETTHNQLSTALRKKCAYICPHLNTASPELFGGSLMTAECPDYTFSQIRDLERKHQAPYCYKIYNSHDLLRLGKCVTWSQCPQPNCITRYCLHRIRSTYHGITLAVSRDFPGDPTHTAWLAQMEQTAAETKVEGDSVNISKSYTWIMTWEPNLQTGQVNTQWKLCEREKVHECGPRFKECGWECVQARCRAFTNS